jgi:uncharacterized protein (TIGR03083 family)
MTDRPSLLTPDAYLHAFGADGDRLASLARATALHAPVPTCPGWTLLDLVRHCGDVYANKIAALRLGRRPQPGEWELAEDRPADAAVEWFDEVRAELSKVLAERDPAEECWTWMPGEHTVAFWQRRMAHETLVHRVDAEAAAGAPIEPPHDDLAADGVHEVLQFAGRWVGRAESAEGRAGRVAVRAGGRTWLVDLPDDGHHIDVGSLAESADAEVSGDPLAVDLALWGRSAALAAAGLSPGAVRMSGDPDVLQRLQARLLLVN